MAAMRSGSPADVIKLVQGTVELPTMPEVLVRLNAVMDQEDASAADIAKVLQTDPAIAANLLRMVNSAYYGLRVRVSSIPLAVSVLGFATTRRLALRAAVFNTFARRRERAQGFDPAGFWRHSVFTGVAARALAAVSSSFADMHPEDAYMAGLLHDIGKILLLEKCTARYVAALRRGAQEGRPDSDAERAEFGFTHAEVGSVLALKWSLPEDLAAAIRYHHAPPHAFAHQSLACLVHVADQLAWRASLPSTVGTRTPAADPAACGAIGLRSEVVEAMLPTLLAEFADAEMPW